MGEGDGRGMAAHEELTAVFQQERWRSPDSNWAIGIVRGGMAVVGSSEPGELIPGVEYKFLGERKSHPRYGPQFEYKAFVQQQPHGKQGVVAFLCRYAQGIGTRRANDIFDKYRHDAISVLKTDPARVAAEVSGVTLKMAQEIAEKLKQGEKLQATRIDLLEILDGSGLPVEKTIDKALKKWGIAAADKIRRDPFILLQYRFPLIGFDKADHLYKRMGLPLTAIRRQIMACWYCVHRDMSGSTWLSEQEIAYRMAQYIDSGLQVAESIAACVESGHLMREMRDLGQGRQIFYADKKNAEAEFMVARRLRELMEAGEEQDGVESEGSWEALL